MGQPTMFTAALMRGIFHWEHRGFLILASVGASLLVCGNVFGQGTVMNTGVGPTLQTEVVLLPEPVFGDAVSFEFGFATDEVFAPEQIFDSFTVTLQSIGATPALILVTLDVSGVVVAPGGGGIDIPPGNIQAVMQPYPSLSPVLAMKSAYIVTVPIVSELVGAPLQVIFDLFDNQDSVASQGYFANVALVVVPEPKTGAMLIGGCGLLILLRRRLSNSNRGGRE